MTMDSRRLWAKSKGEHKAEVSSMFLPGHLQDVLTAARQVLDATVDDQLLALGLDIGRYRERLCRCVLVAAAIHDLGKANDHFQGMICRTQDRHARQQGIRHEWVTILMLEHLRAWLLPAMHGNETDFAIVGWAIAGHHPAHDRASPPTETPKNGGTGPEIKLLCGHPDFHDALKWLEEAFSLETPPRLANLQLDLGRSGQVFPVLKAWAIGAKKIWERFDREDRQLVAGLKNCLIAADVAGSALPKVLPHDDERWTWIKKSFKDKPKAGDLEKVVLERSRDFRDRNEDRERFQAAVANSSTPVTYVKAGCGTGKTLAAYMWAAKNHPTRRLYFCYPTTGTTTEGFKDYLYEPDVKSDLFHSRRDVDCEIILNTPQDEEAADAAIRIDSLAGWSTPIVACTVDTVLGLVQNNKRGMFAWPALAQAAFVFDEIHAYDDRLFGALLRFLRDLPGLPALLMTASLPTARERALRTVLHQDRGMELEHILGPTSLEELRRYKKVTAPDNDPVPLVRKTLENGDKVLWVGNTVKRVLDASGRMAGYSPLIYHSRFKYEDRVRRHKAVIEAFNSPGAALAICSQVAEMSLDLSADLLVSDLATIPALIQRLGRLNRRAKSGDPSKPFIVVEPDSYAPYVKNKDQPYPINWPDDTRDWLAKLGDDPVNQKDLASTWTQEDDLEVNEVDSAWLDGGPTTLVKELRDGSVGITVLMSEDLPRLQANRKEFGKLTLPMMPPNLPWQAWKRERGLPVAPPGSIIYDPMRGAEWKS